MNKLQTQAMQNIAAHFIPYCNGEVIPWAQAPEKIAAFLFPHARHKYDDLAGIAFAMLACCENKGWALFIEPVHDAYYMAHIEAGRTDPAYYERGDSEGHKWALVQMCLNVVELERLYKRSL